VSEQLLDERLAKLEQARSWSPRLVSKLESHIRAAEDEGLFRINPFTLAREKNVPLNEFIDVLLYASAYGLFSLDWLLLCPQCSCVVESFRSLEGVHNHYHCKLCQMDYEAALDDYIAVTFTVSPEIGQTVNIAARVQHLADADEIYLSESVYEAEGVKPQLEPLAVDSTLARLKGIQQDMRVYRIAPARAMPAPNSNP
jgi:hypothetical protein